MQFIRRLNIFSYGLSCFHFCEFLVMLHIFKLFFLHWCAKETSIGCLSHTPKWGGEAEGDGQTWPATQACALTSNRNRRPFGLQDHAQPTEPHQSGQVLSFNVVKFIILFVVCASLSGLSNTFYLRSYTHREKYFSYSSPQSAMEWREVGIYFYSFIWKITDPGTVYVIVHLFTNLQCQLCPISCSNRSCLSGSVLEFLLFYFSLSYPCVNTILP